MEFIDLGRGCLAGQTDIMFIILISDVPWLSGVFHGSLCLSEELISLHLQLLDCLVFLFNLGLQGLDLEFDLLFINLHFSG